MTLAEKKTLKNNALQINLALNYGSKYEILDAFKKMQKNVKVNEKNFIRHLQTKNILDPDLLIRTGDSIG